MKTLGFENSNLESFGLENLGCFEKDFEVGLEVAIGRAGPGQQWAGPKQGRAKIGPVFSGQNFNSPARPKNRAGRAK